MDDWALATVADLEDRTRVRGVAGAVTASGKRRRRRSVQDSSYAQASTGARPAEFGASTVSRIVAQPKGMKLLAWGMVVVALLVLALGVTATFVLIRSGTETIPTVTGIQASQVEDSIKFSWGDPGITSDDQYQITTPDGETVIQGSPSFVVNAKPGDRACIVVSVNRSGSTGPPSSQKCAVLSE
jgi:hypothetical protein